MYNINSNQTICAISTAPGQGAIAVIRLSGSQAIEITAKIFAPANKNINLKNQPANTLHFGNIISKNEIIDEVVVAIFRAPKSYTAEDIVEISCHGSIYIQNRILNILINNGAKLAEPGEFTLRAFLNHKIDLSQAEAVAELIASKSEVARKLAINQMKGGFAKEIKIFRDKLTNFMSLIELELDFGEEDVEFADRKQLINLISEIKAKIITLKNSFKLGNALKNGIPVVIVGEPNSGKSTLLNKLINDDIAIVSDIAGTTRDAIEENLIIENMMYRFIDTAGIRTTDNEIEKLGIKKTFNKIDKAEIVIFLVSPTDNNINENVDKIYQYIKNKNKKLIIVINKIDILKAKININIPEKLPIIEISAKYDKNIEQLKKKLVEIMNFDNTNDEMLIVTNQRHYEALNNANDGIDRIIDSLKNNIPSDFIAMDIRQVLFELSSIIGDISVDNILENIFSNFCIGK